MSAPDLPSALQPLAGFVTPDALAARCNISRRTLARWHAKRIGPPRCVVGRLILYRVEAVDAWMAGKELDPRAGDRQRR